MNEEVKCPPLDAQVQEAPQVGAYRALNIKGTRNGVLLASAADCGKGNYPLPGGWQLISWDSQEICGACAAKVLRKHLIEEVREEAFEQIESILSQRVNKTRFPISSKEEKARKSSGKDRR